MQYEPMYTDPVGCNGVQRERGLDTEGREERGFRGFPENCSARSDVVAILCEWMRNEKGTWTSRKCGLIEGKGARCRVIHDVSVICDGHVQRNCLS